MEDLEIREAHQDDVPEIIEVERETWGEAAATDEMFRARIETFPEGVLVGVRHGRILGVVVAELLNYDLDHPISTWAEATASGFIRGSHVPNGNAGYGVDLAVIPKAGFGRVGTRLMKEILDRIVVRRGLAFGVLGSRMPGYRKMCATLKPEEYAFMRRIGGDRVSVKPGDHEPPGRAFDPELAFYESLGFRPLKILPEYFEDPESCGNGVLMVWRNPKRSK